MGATLRWVLGSLGSAGGALGAAVLAAEAAAWAAGPQVSDVGVRMYARGGLAVLVGIATYLGLGGLVTGLVVRGLPRSPRLVFVALGCLGLVFLGFAALLVAEYA